MKRDAFLGIGLCILVCLTGLSFSASFCFGINLHSFCSGGGDPTPLPPNPPPPPPPDLGLDFKLI